MTVKYSVVIPIYNAEKTVNRCVDSLLNQNFDAAEIILVNDGSTDSCKEICEQYSRNAKNVKYFEQENCGVSTARNLGIAKASGKYVMFVDSDDYVTDDYFSTIDKFINEKDCDLLQFSFLKTDGVNTTNTIYSPYYSDNKDCILQKLSGLMCKKAINSPCAKVYKKSIVDKYNVDFTVGASIAEDRAFNIKYALHINTLRIIDTALYCVCLENEDSLSRKKMNDLDEQMKIVEEDINSALLKSELSHIDKHVIINALNFGKCRTIYKKAKDLHRDKERWYYRIKVIRKLNKEINKQKLTYPKTKYCRLITLPVRWNLPWIIDIIAWKLTH